MLEHTASLSKSTPAFIAAKGPLARVHAVVLLQSMGFVELQIAIVELSDKNPVSPLSLGVDLTPALIQALFDPVLEVA